MDDLRPDDRSAAIAALRAILGDRLSTGPSVLDQHARDESWHHPARPDAVAHPRATEEVSAICAACHAHGLPIIPWGVGSSVEGALIPLRGGVVVNLSGMDAILRVSPEDFDCAVQPGVRRRALNAHLNGTGLFFPVDPGADASLGGMAATRASGTASVRYGTMADQVRGLEVVLADGRVIRTGGRARKSASGYDLTRLMMGTEGTLGIITELTLRLHPLPEAMLAVTCRFPDLDAAVATATEVMGAGLGVARIELLDETMIDAVNLYSKTDMPLVPHLFFEFHGAEGVVGAEADVVEAIAQGHGAQGFARATRPEDRARLWRARHDCAYACQAYRAPRRMLTTDVCVPLSALAGCIEQSRADAATAGITAPVLGHVGDGNFHMVLLIDPDDAAEVARAEGVAHRLVERALAAGGTATGEHGVGLGKRAHMRAEHGGAVDVMLAIKAALDPAGLMNPGKVLPD